MHIICCNSNPSLTSTLVPLSSYGCSYTSSYPESNIIYLAFSYKQIKALAYEDDSYIIEWSIEQSPPPPDYWFLSPLLPGHTCTTSSELLLLMFEEYSWKIPEIIPVSIDFIFIWYQAGHLNLHNLVTVYLPHQTFGDINL